MSFFLTKKYLLLSSFVLVTIFIIFIGNSQLTDSPQLSSLIKESPCWESYLPYEQEAILNEDFNKLYPYVHLVSLDEQAIICWGHLLGYEDLKVEKANLLNEGTFYRQLNIKSHSTYLEIPISEIKDLTDFSVELMNLKGDILFTSIPAIYGDPSFQDKQIKIIISDEFQLHLNNLLQQVDAKHYNFAESLLKQSFNHLDFVIVDENLNASEINYVEVTFLNKQPHQVKIYLQSGKTITQTGLTGSLILIKYDEAFNQNAFFWDDSMVSWFSVEIDEQLVESTLNFWYSLQFSSGENKGLIPREIRTQYYQQLNKDEQIFQQLSFHDDNSFEINNPFFLSQIELALYEEYSDKERLEQVLPNLINYFYWVENHRRQNQKINESCLYYYWTSNKASGMDNSPRGGKNGNWKNFKKYAWLDTFAQQVILAQDITQIAKIIGDDQLAKQSDAVASKLAKDFKTCHFDNENQMFYDILPYGEWDTQTPTAAFVWGLKTGVLSSTEVEQLTHQWLENDQLFGGEVILPSLSRSHPDFSSQGEYWSGGAWPPLWWLLIESLEEEDVQTAQKVKDQVLQIMLEVYQTDGSVYEYYSPNRDDLGRFRPGSGYRSQFLAKDNFLGWGKLPLKLLFN